MAENQVYVSRQALIQSQAKEVFINTLRAINRNRIFGERFFSQGTSPIKYYTKVLRKTEEGDAL
jgi:hypothetical protein